MRQLNKFYGDALDNYAVPHPTRGRPQRPPYLDLEAAVAHQEDVAARRVLDEEGDE